MTIARGTVAVALVLALGAVAPAVTLVALDGHTLATAELTGRYGRQ